MRLDPRTKLLILAITSVSAFMNKSTVMEMLLVFAAALLLICHKKWRTALKTVAFFSLLLAVQLWIVPLLPNATGGIIFMFDMYIRKLIPAAMLGSLLVSTTRVSEFLAAISRFHLPKGFTISLAITLRYFPTMAQEWRMIRDAMSLRNISTSFGGLLCHPLRTMEYVYVPMLVSASKISDEIAQAAITRGIDHARARTSIESVGFFLGDFLVFALYAVIIMLMVWAAKGGIA